MYNFTNTTMNFTKYLTDELIATDKWKYETLVKWCGDYTGNFTYLLGFLFIVNIGYAIYEAYKINDSETISIMRGHLLRFDTGIILLMLLSRVMGYLG